MMTRRQSLFAYAALFVGVITFASSFVRPSAGQQPTPAQGQVGRYQIAVGGSGGSMVYVIDTVTGKVWSRIYNDFGFKWSEVAAPPVTK
jgi:hypothetical protein